MPSEELLDRDGQVQRGAGEGRRDARRRGPAPELEGRAGRASTGGDAHGHRRPVRRDQGADRRLLDLAGASRMDEAIEWVKRAPIRRRATTIEIRQVFEAEDFGDEFTPELREQEERLRAQVDGAARVLSRSAVTASATSTATIDAVWRIESAAADRRRSRGSCATSASPRSSRRTRWSPRSSSGRESGVPDNPGAWLMATAKHRAIDRLRRARAARAQARRSWAASSRSRQAADAATSTPRSTTTSATTCCA